MLFNVSVWVTHDEFNYDTDDDWRIGPDDDFVPAEYNTVHYMAQRYDDVSWSDVRNIRDSWAYAPCDIDVCVIPA